MVDDSEQNNQGNMKNECMLSISFYKGCARTYLATFPCVAFILSDLPYWSWINDTYRQHEYSPNHVPRLYACRKSTYILRNLCAERWHSLLHSFLFAAFWCTQPQCQNALLCICHQWQAVLCYDICYNLVGLFILTHVNWFCLDGSLLREAVITSWIDSPNILHL